MQLIFIGKAVSPARHAIVFDHVSFSYEKKPILRDVSVTLPDKTMTDIVGPSGSGKTTFCNLVARFWDVECGRVILKDAPVSILDEATASIDAE